ncbi:hypothetical protein [Kitasatospora sp. NBC_01539]|uniref:WXG100-like domain-containing protein n=1 Tax=Kitasatospora sp. NBC_01539 TaxID=2903577 RepID=UPI003860290B
MAVELPEPLQWVLLLLAGTRWPEADEDQLRDMADRCRRTAEGLKDAAQSADATMKRALDGQKGTAAEALGKYWEKYSVGKGTEQDPGYLPGAINSLNGMGDMLEQVANSAETAKIQIIAQLGILAFELATAEAEAPFTAGASLLQVPVMIGASRLVVSQLLKQLMKEMVEMAVKQAAQMAAINLLAQGIELAEGHRKSIDMKELGQNALGGAVGGASAHLIGKSIGAAGKKIGAENALNTTAGKMASGAAVGVGADVSTQLITTGKVDGDSLLGSGLSGGAGAGLHAGASALKGHAAAPTPAEPPKLDLPSTSTAGGHDGPSTFTKSDTASGDSAYHGPSGTTSGGSGSGGAATGTAGTGTRTGSGADSAGGAGSSVGHASATGAGESKVNGLTPFGSGRSTGTETTADTTAGATAHGTTAHGTTAPPVQEQAGTHVQENIAPHADSRTAAPRTETEPTMVRSERPATPLANETTPPANETTVQAHESAVPRQEPVSTGPTPERSAPQVHESAAPRVEPVTVQPRESAAPVSEHVTAQPHENVVPRQEPAAQVHESVTPRQEPAAAPLHESAVPRQEPVSTGPTPERSAPQVHESAAPRVEPVTVQPRESAAPVSEHVTAQPHENVVPRQEPAAQVHESVTPRQEPAAAPLHESAVPRQESPASTSETVAPRAAEQAAGSMAAQQSAVPNLSGVVGNAASLAGAGGTHLDGGTRAAAAPAPARPVGPEQMPGQVLPDAVPDATPSSTATPNPMTGGGYMPAAATGGAGTAGRGGAGASGRTTPPGTVPQQVGGREAPAAGPVRTESGGGTIRSGAGRTSDTHVPSPPPPPQHQAVGTSRTLGDPNGSAPSTSRTGRTGDEHLPPPPPPANTRLRPIDEPPTAAELAQLHQHPGGPALIHPPAADPAALRRYKDDNKFTFRLTGELGTAANSLPHSSWGRHDSGSRLPDGRPDVKVSPYSQSFKSHLDPLTLKALHPLAANVITPPLRNELGPEAMAFQGNQVLEAAGSLDFRTQEHFQQQEVRRNVLERLARQDSEQAWQPVGAQRVADHLDGSTSAMDGVNRLLGGHDGRPGFDGIVLGEAHSQSPSWGFLNENMHELKAAGVDRIYVESLRDDAFQRDLDAYQRPGGTMSPNLETMLRTYDRNLNSPAGNGLYETVVRAKAEGVTVHAVDGYPARRPHEPGPQALQERARLLNSYMNHAISSGGSGKYVLVTGKAHVHEHATSSEHRIPGVAEMLGAPAVRLTDAGRPNPNGAPHDASTATDSGNLRLGHLPPEPTGHNPANAAQHRGDDTPSVPHLGEGSPAQSTRSLGGDDPLAPPVPPTRHSPAGTPQSGGRPAAPTTPGTDHNTPSTAGHDKPSGTGSNAPATSAHDRIPGRQEQARDTELRPVTGESPAYDAVDQPGHEQSAVAVPPAGADRLRQDLPGMSPEQRAQELANLSPENRRWLARDPQTVDSLKAGLPPREFADTAAQLIVHVDPRAEQAASARHEAQQQVARLLQDPDTAARLLKNGADVVIVPKDVRMPEVPELHSLRGVHNDGEAGSGRGYDDMRGSGGRHTAVTEENLLGERTPIGQVGHYQDGYSTTTHEFSHTVHQFGLDAHDQTLITDVFDRKSADPAAKWPDGPLRGADGEKNYSARDEMEYFAQVSNAYLGTNHGTDPFTHEARNNGAAWVRANEPELLPLLQKLYGSNPAKLHDRQANPVNATDADNAMYEGLREFTENVEGTTGVREQPAPEAPQAPAPSARQRGAAQGERLPPTAPPVSGDDHEHKIDGEKAFDTIATFLDNSPEFEQVRSELEGYDRPPLLPADTDVILDQYRNEKFRHVDVLSRGVDPALAKVDGELAEVQQELKTAHPDQRAELDDRHAKLQASRDLLQEQRDRMAIFEHERLKDRLTGNELAVRTRERQEAELRVLPGAIKRIEAEEARTKDLLDEAKAKDAEEQKQAKAKGRTPSRVFSDRVKDLESRQTALEADRTQREKAVSDAGAAVALPAPAAQSSAGKSTSDPIPMPGSPEKSASTGKSSASPKKKTGQDVAEEWKRFEDNYRNAFGYSGHSLMEQQPHAEKIVQRLDSKGNVRLTEASVNRNHVIADYMVHKYVTAAVFKARSLDENSRAAASDAFGDFVTVMAPDRHRILDTYGTNAAARLKAGGSEEAVLVRRDLTATAADVDLKATYGNEELPKAFDTAGVGDRRSADDAREKLERELKRNGLDVPAREQLDALAAAVGNVHPAGPTREQVEAVHDAMGQLETKVKGQAVEDLALVNGVIGPRMLDDTVSALRDAAVRSDGWLTQDDRNRLAGQLDDLAGRPLPSGSRQVLTDTANALRENRSTQADLNRLADQLPGERAQLRTNEIDRRIAELGDPTKDTKRPNTKADDDRAAAEKKRDDREKELADAVLQKPIREAEHAQAKQQAETSAKIAKANPTDAVAKKRAEDDAKAEKTARDAAKRARDEPEKAEARLVTARRDLETVKAVQARVQEVYGQELPANTPGGKPPVAKAKHAAARVAWTVADVELVGRQYGGVYARAGAGGNHPTAMFDRALTANLDDVPALIEDITAGLSNSGSNLRFGDETVNKWIQNFLDPHIIRDPELLTAVAHGQLPPEALYAPHTADLVQAVRRLEAGGLVPPELRDMMASKTQADLEPKPNATQSPSSRLIVDDLAVVSNAAPELPVSSSGDFAARADANQLPADRLGRLGGEDLYRLDRVQQPGDHPTAGATADPDAMVIDSSRPSSQPAHAPDGDTVMADASGGTTARPDLKRGRDEMDPDSDSDSDGGARVPKIRRQLAGLDLNGPTPPPPPPPSTPHNGGTRGLGRVLPPPPPPVAHNSGTGGLGRVLPSPAPPITSAGETSATAHEMRFPR